MRMPKKIISSAVALSIACGTSVCVSALNVQDIKDNAKQVCPKCYTEHLQQTSPTALCRIGKQPYSSLKTSRKIFLQKRQALPYRRRL